MRAAAELDVDSLCLLVDASLEFCDESSGSEFPSAAELALSHMEKWWLLLPAPGTSCAGMPEQAGPYPLLAPSFPV